MALTLSDSFCVDRHRAEFLDLIRSGIDILFANESEIAALYETKNFDDAAAQARKDVPLAALTRSAKGSIIFSNGSAVEIPVDPVASVVDTTGAGDLYAAGVLYGLSKGLSLDKAGRLGSLAAAEIISHIGARPEKKLAEIAIARGLN